MGKREALLDCIAELNAEAETAKTYGDDWKLRDWKTRQSMKAGELCLAVGTLAQAEAKVKQRPGSKGARKAKKEGEGIPAEDKAPGRSLSRTLHRLQDDSTVLHNHTRGRV